VPVLNDLDVSVTERQFGRVHGGPINLSRAELCRARLDQATLIEANLLGAVLTEADLSDARLEKADLRGSKLAYANLDGARLNGANLSGADLSLARGLTQAQIDQGVGDHRTALPAHLNTPKGWLKDSRSATGAAQIGEAGTISKDPHAILGVDPGASMQDIRAAWLRQIKDLDPDRSAGEPPVSERIKAINQAYQELKDAECHAKEEHTRSAIRRGPRIAFAAALVVVIAVGALIATVETYLDHPVVVAPSGATPAVHTRVQAAPSG
jgi:DnaJ-domain-containing protein 1